MRVLAVLALAVTLAGCAGGGGRSANAGDACEAAGHKPGTPGHAACTSKQEQDQAQATRRIANSIPLDGYGPIGRF